MKVKIIIFGKIKEKTYLKKINEYVKWIRRDIQIELIYLKDIVKSKSIKKLKGHINQENMTICLSEGGEKKSSKQFSRFLYSNTFNYTFILGGPNGLPKVAQEKANMVLSMSEMTFPHEMALLILTEQIYRAISIRKGSKYHR